MMNLDTFENTILKLKVKKTAIVSIDFCGKDARGPSFEAMIDNSAKIKYSDYDSNLAICDIVEDDGQQTITDMIQYLNNQGVSYKYDTLLFYDGEDDLGGIPDSANSITYDKQSNTVYITVESLSLT